MQRSKTSLQDIAIEQLCQGQYQPRQVFDPVSLEELAASIQSTGLIQPLVVRPTTQNNYEIVAGERRWRAAQLAGLDTVPCLVNHYSDEQAAAVTTIENINRVDLNPIEEARAYQRLMHEFNYLHEEIAAVVGKSRAKISNSLRLLKLNPRVQHMLVEGQLSEGHGKVIAGLAEHLQYKVAQECVRKDWNVRKIETEVKKLQESGSKSTESDADVVALESALADHIGCKVKIDFANQKGQLKIDFHNFDILEGLFAKLGFNPKNANDD